MNKEYYLHQKGEQKGPWAKEMVLAKLTKKEIEWTDYIFDTNVEDWVFLLDHPDFSQEFQRWTMAQEKKQDKNGEQMSEGPFETAPKKSGPKEEWYILKDENKYGPFEYLEVVKLLQW
jgi:hypothetical protein